MSMEARRRASARYRARLRKEKEPDARAIWRLMAARFAAYVAANPKRNAAELVDQLVAQGYGEAGSRRLVESLVHRHRPKSAA